MLTVRGRFQEGAIQLLEPVNQPDGDVLVTFLDRSLEVPTLKIVFGMFSGTQQSTEADVQEAEFLGESGDIWKPCIK